MIQNNQNEQLLKVGNWVSARLNKFEIILASIFFLAIALKLVTDLNSSIIMVITLMTLANLYFLNAFSDFESTGALEVFFHKLVSIASSVSVIGILFRLQHWPGYDFMLAAGCLALILTFAAILYLKSTKPEVRIFNQRLLIRISIIALFGLILLLSSNETLLDAGL
jgi:hypothetical protein